MFRTVTLSFFFLLCLLFSSNHSASAQVAATGGGEDVHRVITPLIQELQTVLSQGEEAARLKAFFLTEAEADSVAAYYADLTQSFTEEQLSGTRQLFLERCETARTYLTNHYLGDLARIIVQHAEEGIRQKLHFYRVKAQFLNGSGVETLEIGLINVDGQVRIVHAGSWPEP